VANDDPEVEEAEGRRHHRPLARLAVEVLSKHGHRLPADVRGETMDLAVGGLRQPATIEAEVKVLRCSEPSGAPEIRRYDVATEFTRMDPADKKTLQSCVNSL